MFSFIDWQPSITLFSIGSVDVRWYSLLWIVGLILAYLIVQRLYKDQKIDENKFEPLFLYCFIGVVAGARLGHCIFYEPGYYLTDGKHFLEMFIPFRYEYVAELGRSKWVLSGYQGLASHGGTIGLFLALLFYARKYKMSFMHVLDNIALAAPMTACCIRLGNLMNSEIIGSPTDVPWAFIFHTSDAMVNGELVPRHPSQLYEALAYFFIFIIGFILYKYFRSRVGTGFFFGWCLTSIFTFRFFVEFIKDIQVDFEKNIPLDMGQILSIPFIAVGLYFLFRKKPEKSVQ